jgi:Uncharacterised protein family (UPF0182)
MFEIAYLLIVALAALPLARSLLLGASGDHIAFVHRLYRDAAYMAIAILAVFCLEAALRISLENYWFAELGQSHRFWLSIEYRVGIFLVILCLVGLFVGVNLWLLCRLIPIVPRSAPWIVGFAIAGLLGFLATSLWVPLMRFLGATTADVADPVFGKDLSFYLLVLPLYDDVVEIIVTIARRADHSFGRSIYGARSHRSCVCRSQPDYPGVALPYPEHCRDTRSL